MLQLACLLDVKRRHLSTTGGDAYASESDFGKSAATESITGAVASYAIAAVLGWSKDSLKWRPPLPKLQSRRRGVRDCARGAVYQLLATTPCTKDVAQSSSAQYHHLPDSDNHTFSAFWL